MNHTSENEKLIFLSYFKGHEDHFAYQGDSYYRPINQPLSGKYLDKHFNGLATFGIYILNKSSKCNFICIDIDIQKGKLEDIEFKNQNVKHKYLKDKLIIFRNIITEKLNIEDSAILFEDTGGRGYHIWIFFKEAIAGNDALKLYYIVKKYADFSFEFFPKQSNLSENCKYGNLIKLPLGLHQKYYKISTFFTINDSGISFISTLKNNFLHLQTIKKVDKAKVKEIIKNNKALLEKEVILEIKNEKITEIGRICYKDDLNFLFENCPALNELIKKANQNNELNHAELFHLSNIILSIPNREEFLIDIIRKSLGSKFNNDITRREIDLIKNLYPTSCNKLIQDGICKIYCNKAIEEKNSDPLLPNTTPLSFWLTPIKRKNTINNDELINYISDIGNIKNAYWKLKKYYSYEDALFYDEFDFEQFEKELDIYTQYISLYFKQKEEIPFLGYLKVNFPKKVDKNEQMQYRQMAYSTIFDQIIIQSIFNAISIIFEDDFQDSSYGYRFNTDKLNVDDIFRDWREYYPIFRNKLLNQNRKKEIKYRVSCDISKFYDNIKHDILFQQIQKYISDDYICSTIIRIIDLYKYDGITKKGLPQGPAYARILANLYLNDFDKKIIQCASGYYRYVDDMFLFFRNEKDAIEVSRKIVILLSELGLELSQDSEKRLEIVKTSKEDKLVNYLDSIRYGIFEEFKTIDSRNAEEEIQNFYKNVEDKIIPHDFQKIIEINDNIPSVIYLITKHFPFTIELKEKILAIVNYLVKNKIFFPKRLKSKKVKFIFYEIIHLLYKNKINIDFLTFYKNLDDCHKIYFFLCLYYIYKTQEKYKEELNKITEINLNSANAFLKGFAMIIAKKIKLEYDFLNNEYIKDIGSCESYFLKLKFYSFIDYFELSEELRSSIRCNLKPSSDYITKKYFLKNISYKDEEYSDILFLSNLFKSKGYLLLPECCMLFKNIKNNDDLFVALEKFIISMAKYKKLTIDYLKSTLLDFHKNSSKTLLENRIMLYTEIEDPELKRELMNVILKISDELTVSEEKGYKLSSYNGCFLREYIDKESDNSYYEEIIPYDRLIRYKFDDLSYLESCLMDLSLKNILPEINFEFDSSKEEITLRYLKPQNFVDFDSDLYSDDEESIFNLFLVIDDLFKKSEYFYKKLNIIPLIEVNELMVNQVKNEVIIKSFAKILCPKYIIDSSVIDNSKAKEIPKLISNIVKRVIFKNDKNYDMFRESAKIGIKLFLNLFIYRLASNYPYSYSRFHYLIDQIRNINTEVNYEFKLSLIYFYEEFKSNLFIRNQENIDWMSICKSLKLLYEDIEKNSDFIDFNNVDYKNKISMNRKYTGNFHYLSIQLLNILLNIDGIFKIGNIECTYSNLLNLLNYYAILCIEIICMIKAGINSSEKIIKELPSIEHLNVNINERSYELNDKDIESINILIRLKNENLDLFNYSVNYDLKHISILFLLIYFDLKVHKNNIIILNNAKLNDKHFKLIFHTFFICIPNIELMVSEYMRGLLNDLKTNQNRVRVSIDNSILENDVLKSCRLIHLIIKSLGIKRYEGKNVFAEEWGPIKIHLKRYFKIVVADSSALEKIPLVGKFPSSTVKCSWDICNGKVINAVIPSNGFNRLLSKLQKGKIFGYKWKYFYSEKARLIYDFIICLLFAMLAIVSHNLIKIPVGSKEPLFYWPFNRFITEGLSLVSLFFFCKALFKDVKYWSKDIYEFIKYFNK